MARKSRKAGRGRHNRVRLRKINEELFANGIAAQPSLTRAEQFIKDLRKKKQQTETLRTFTPLTVFPPEELDTNKQAYLERKRKREERRQQSEKARKEKLEREIKNQSQKG